MKIVYCTPSVSQMYGTEKATVMKANALAAIPGNEVFVVITEDPPLQGCSMLSPQVKLVNLGINYFSSGDWSWSKTRYLLHLARKRRLHRQRLKEFLRAERPDVAVSTGHPEKYMLPSLRRYVKVLVREFHFPRNPERRLSRLRDRVVYRLSCWFDSHFRIGSYDAVAVLTEEDLVRNWKNRRNFTVIPNFVTFSTAGRRSPLTERKVIAVGRLAPEKNMSSLIRAFGAVAERHPDWSLEIWGDGCERQALRRQIEDLHLSDNVHLCGVTDRVQEKMLGASVFALSSQFEGFGLVIVEAMACGLPVVSYDCPCGPRAIISRGGESGFLVPQDDERMLAERICFLIENPDVRAAMGAAAVTRAADFAPEKIIPMWMSLFERLLAEHDGKKSRRL